MRQTLIAGALVVASMLLAQTASAAEFYVVRDTTTKKCTVVDSKPTSTTKTVVMTGRCEPARHAPDLDGKAGLQLRQAQRDLLKMAPEFYD